MPLFDIPGWSVPPSIPESVSSASKKRKRSSGGFQKLPPMDSNLNLDKLVKKLGNSAENVPGRHKKKRKLASFLGNTSKAEKDEDTRMKVTDAQKPISISRPIIHPEAIERGSFKQARKSKIEPILNASLSQLPSAKYPDGSQGLTRLQQGMRQSLDGARFRLINESLYKTNSSQAHRMMKEDPQIFEDYHVGFRHQVQVWPTNPVEHYKTILSTYPPKTVIADLGCGDAALARALVPKGMAVLSFDMVSDGSFVIEADICARIPLPGSESTEDTKSNGEGQITDVVICSLSLMGTDWPNCLRETWRILKPGGELKIAEVASRFSDVEEFQNLVNTVGFQLMSKDNSNSHFTLFEYRKVPRKNKSEKEWQKVLARAKLLKPCEYKRR